jgi:hypothetical protein
MLNLPIKPARTRKKRHNRVPLTGYFTEDGAARADELARKHNYSISELLEWLVDNAHRQMKDDGQ